VIQIAPSLSRVYFPREIHTAGSWSQNRNIVTTTKYRLLDQKLAQRTVREYVFQTNSSLIHKKNTNGSRGQCLIWLREIDVLNYLTEFQENMWVLCHT
jgi:hypothetical protein